MKDKALKIVYEILVVSLIWGSVWAVIGTKALPGGPVFSLFALFVFAVTLGRIVSLNNNVPPLIGMLLAGFILRNAFTSSEFDVSLSPPFRRFARGVVLIRAGLLLNAKLLQKNIRQCVRLALLPCVLEASVIAIGAHIFHVLPLEWGYLLGFATASVSPAVIVPSMFSLKQRSLGIDKGIDTIVIAAATIENISSIALFGVVLSLIFSAPKRITVWALLEGPLEICSGLCFGVICGLILWFIPYDQNSRLIFKRNYSLKRFILIVLFGAFACFGSGKAGFRFAGSLACVVEAFVAAHKWKQYYSMKFVEKHLKVLWSMICEPLLFSIIGADLKLSYLEQEDVEILVICVILAVILRTMAMFIVLWDINFDLKERLFIAISGIPKATVQASLAPIALELSQQSPDLHFDKYATLVLATSVLSIFMTAPIGAFAIYFCAPKLLHKNNFTTESIEYGVVSVSLASTSLTKNADHNKNYATNQTTVIN